MAKIINCPRCESSNVSLHCRSLYCLWYVCALSPGLKIIGKPAPRVTVFNGFGDKRSFVREDW